MWCDCPFWPDDGMCRLRDCSVCECPENEFPKTFRESSSLSHSSDDIVCQEGKPEATVDRTIDTKAFRGWIVEDNPWTNDDETDTGASYYFSPFFTFLTVIYSPSPPPPAPTYATFYI